MFVLSDFAPSRRISREKQERGGQEEEKGAQNMELSAFAAPSFSATQWLNSLLDPLDPSESAIESTANEVSFKLQLFIHQLSLSLQDTAFQIHQRTGLLAKLQRDFEALRSEAIVKNGMILQELESNRSAQYLDLLDTIKTRMEEAQSALREADSWSILVSDVESLFQQHNLELLVERVTQLERSLDTLRSAPDFAQKSQTLERIKNRLEASMAPRLVSAVNSVMEEDAARWFILFGKIGLEKQALSYYQGCIKARLQELWSSQNHSNLKQVLLVFHRELTSECEKQLVFVGRHLSLGDVGARGVLAEMASDVLTAMEPPLQDAFENWLADQADVLESILDILGVQLQLAISLERVICLEEEAKFLPEVSKLAGTLFTFLGLAVSRYAQYQEQQIQRQLQTVQQPEDNFDLRALQESHQILRRNAEKLFTLLFSAETACNERTQSSCYPGFLDAASKLIRLFVDQCRKDLNTLLKIAAEADQLDHWDLVNEVLIRANCVATYKKSISELCTKVEVTISRIPYLKERYGVLSDLVSNLLTPSLRQRFKALQTSKPQLEWMHSLEKLEQETQHVGVRVVTSRVIEHVKAMPGALRSAESMPNFASSPLEYVTQIGQYLMTLPQYLDISQHLPSDDEHSIGASSTGGGSWMLELACREVSNITINEVMQLTYLPDTTCHQLATDLGYLCDVLDDLSFAEVTQPLQELKALLSCTTEEFAATSKGKPMQIVHMIKTARKIN
ncbi:conserved oligomeric Golgi complex subunit 7-like isoform X2 [Varroa destructor]|uniref:Conserved oligomeric Golgi complex subunit 7 n=1 Tax=Varroa destructor TaxID=109461 RepID=A0A7M7K2I3_VARDE|nr:conserved oligomeric Golgi complex subunit 7-like isoform X2 [Varroa destructor]